MRSVLFPGLDSLVGLAHHGVDVKPTLLRVLTDLYVQKPVHTHDEERQYIELTLRLIDAVDGETRTAVARRLSTYANAPPEILSRIETELTAVRASARRPHDAAPGKAADKSASPSPAAQRATALSQEFFAASPEQRLHLLAKLDLNEPLSADGLPQASSATLHRLEASALGGRPSDFIRELERALGISRTLAESLVNDRSGEPLVVAAKVLAMPIDVLQRILLFVNPAIGHSVARVYALTAVYKAMSPHAAQQLAAAWRDMATATTPAPAARPADARAKAHALRPSRDQEFRARDFTPGAGSAAPVSRRAASAHDPIKKMAT